MSQPDETDATTTQAIDDDQLPDDLNPEENPMAAGLDDNETVDDLLTGGKHAESSEESSGESTGESTGESSGSQDGADGAS